MRIHMIAIGGTGMAPLACLLREQGHEVGGSDGPLYPPMSELLARAGIDPYVGFDAARLEPSSAEKLPDLVIVGNAVPRSNPEAVQAERLGIERVSMPQAVARFLLASRESFVVAGTHGKTTTSAMAATVLEQCGEQPGYLIGGAPLGLPASFAIGQGPRFVIEGDEYNAAYFDRGAKFLHYQPRYLVLTNVEYDHADLYPTPQSFVQAFEELVALLPAQGALAVCADDQPAMRDAALARCRVIAYGHDESAAVRAVEIETGKEGTRFVVEERLAGAPRVRQQVALRVIGEHNVLNALGVWSIARHLGYEPARIALALGEFRGVRRRLEKIWEGVLPPGRGSGAVTGESRELVVIDDFAHHPTEVRSSLLALRQRYPGRRIVVFFEPRSLTAARADFLASYVEALALGDEVHLAPVFHAARLSDEERLDTEHLASLLRQRGHQATAHHGKDDLAECASEAFANRLGLGPGTDRLGAGGAPEHFRGEVWVTMSSGSFGALARRLATILGSLVGANLDPALASGDGASRQTKG